MSQCNELNQILSARKAAKGAPRSAPAQATVAPSPVWPPSGHRSGQVYYAAQTPYSVPQSQGMDPERYARASSLLGTYGLADLLPPPSAPGAYATTMQGSGTWGAASGMAGAQRQRPPLPVCVTCKKQHVVGKCWVENPELIDKSARPTLYAAFRQLHEQWKHNQASATTVHKPAPTAMFAQAASYPAYNQVPPPATIAFTPAQERESLLPQDRPSGNAWPPWAHNMGSGPHGVGYGPPGQDSTSLATVLLATIGEGDEEAALLGLANIGNWADEVAREEEEEKGKAFVGAAVVPFKPSPVPPPRFTSSPAAMSAAQHAASEEQSLQHPCLHATLSVHLQPTLLHLNHCATSPSHSLVWTLVSCPSCRTGQGPL